MKTVQEHEIFRALADQSRLRIVCLLLEGELCVCDLTAVLEMPQPTISRHMSTLKLAGLVNDRRAGKWVHYRLGDDAPLAALKPYLHTMADREPYATDRTRLHQHDKVRTC